MLEHRSLKLPPLNVVVDLALDPTRTVARISSDDGTFRATLVPQGGGRSRLSFKARNWRLPITAASLSFEALEASGVLAGDRLDLPRGQRQALRRQDRRQLRYELGQAVADRRPGAAGGRADGPAAGRARQAGPAFGEGSPRGPLIRRAPERRRSWRTLWCWSAPFEVADGEWHGVDLSRAAELPLGKMSKGGTTKFATLRGDLALRGKQVDVSRICVRSPSLTAVGNVAIAPDKSLSGRLDVSVSKTGGFVGAPMQLSGTTSDPSLSLTKAGAIGAVIGTMLLPVIGTSLGLKASSSLEGKAECK